MRRQSVVRAILCVALSACTHHPQSGTSLPRYPRKGFGRAGCFAGPSLTPMYEGPAMRADSAARRGPWLVLDSTNSVFSATLVTQRDSVSAIAVTWRRLSADSLLFHDGSTIPSVDWRLHVDRTHATGEGVMISDLARPSLNGRIVNMVLQWPISLARVSCTRVPVTP